MLMENLIIALMVLWTIGCTIGPFLSSWWLFNEESPFAAAFMLLITLPLGCVLASIPWILYGQEVSPNLAILKKNEWVCSASHTETTTTYIKSGSVMVPITNHIQVCDQYNKIG